VQTHPDNNLAGDAERALRYLPAPHDAAEAAAIEAAISPRSSAAAFTKGRILAGIAAVAVAVTVPDLSVGAMDSPLLRLEMREPVDVLKQPIWSPAARAPSPVYAPAMAAEVIAPTSLTFSTRRDSFSGELRMPLGFLEQGSERFDLAFAGVEMPSAVGLVVARKLPTQPEGTVRGMASAIRTRVIDVPQISEVTRFTPPLAQSTTRPQGRSGVTMLTAERNDVATDDSVAAVFAGTFDGTSDVRSSLPSSRSPRPQPRLPDPVQQEPVRVAALPIPQSASGGRDLQTELVVKTRLDARINGVVTGKVDFRQLDGTIAVRLGSVVNMLRNRFGATELDRIRGAGAMDSFLTLAQLQAAGVPISYDSVYDEVAFGIDYNDAPQAVKVQVEQIGSPTFRSDAALIDQIPR